MTTLLDRLRSGARGITTLEDFSQALSMYNAFGNDLLLGSPMGGLSQTLGGEPAEEIARSFMGYTRQAYRENGIVFACMLARMSVFSAARFRWQRLRDGGPSDMFGNPDLYILDRPWPGGTTQDLLARMLQDSDLAGNAFVVRPGGSELVRLRPDWVDIVVAKRYYRDGVLGYEKKGYIYYQGGKQQCKPEDVVPFFANEVAHFMPTPDPEASFRGMSWLTPVIREVQGDQTMNRHKQKFFENGATPNMVIRHPSGAAPEKVRRFAEQMAEEYGGVENAYKTLNLYPGADVTVVGKDFRQIDLRSVQGAGETRIAAAAGTPPVIVGLSEGLQAATYSNYAQARRRFADGTIHPLWQNASGSIEPIMPRPSGADNSRDIRLWYDVSNVPFLREDAKDASEIAQQEATTIKTYVDAGFTPESAVKAVTSGDKRLLVHTGLVSVQLLPPGGAQQPESTGPEEPVVPPDEQKARTIAELLPKVATGVDKVITADEGRGVLDLVGAGLGGGFEPPAPPAPPAPPPPPAGGGAPAEQEPPEQEQETPPPQRSADERYNKYHDPHSGKFSSGGTPAGVAEDLHSKALDAEPELTDTVMGLADATGGEVLPITLQFKVKEEGSLTDKITKDMAAAEAAGKPMTAKEAGAKLFDINRYTITYNEGQYAAGSRAALDQLRQQGNTLRVKNFWVKGDNPYQGVNVQVTGKGGQRWELQFHTPTSLDVKEGALHEPYKALGEATPGSPQWHSLLNQSFAASATIPVPPGVSTIA